MKSQEQQWPYDKLVLATGASAFVPPITGRELMLTLNSQQEYRACETQLRDAQRVLIVGGGLIGSELAMDFCRAGKAVTLIDNAASILASLMPPEVSSRLQHRLTDMGVHLLLKSQLQGLEKTESGIRATLDRSRSVEVDAVIAATGLRPETALARRAGLNINRGVCVDSYLQTSHPDIYALGDCAEINGQVLPFLQPICFERHVSGEKPARRQCAIEVACHAGKSQNAGITLASGWGNPAPRSELAYCRRSARDGGQRDERRRPAMCLCRQRRPHERGLCAAENAARVSTEYRCLIY